MSANDEYMRFYHDTLDYLQSINYPVNSDDVSNKKIMELIDNHSFVVLANYLWLLQEECPGNLWGNALAELGSFGQNLAMNIENHGTDRYISTLYVAHMTLEKDLFQKTIGLGLLLIKYLDAHLTKEGIDRSDTKTYSSFTNDKINDFVHETIAHLKDNNILDSVLRGLSPRRMIYTLIDEFKFQDSRDGLGLFLM